MDDQQQPPAKIKLTGMWKKTAANGSVYLSGPLSVTSQLMIFPNTRKEQEKEPDYFCYLYPRQTRDRSQDMPTQPQAQGQAQAQPHQGFPAANHQQQMQQQPKMTADDIIPF